MSKLYDALFDSKSEDSDDEIILKMAYPVTINNTVKWSHTQNVTPVPSQQNRSLHQTKVPSMIGRAPYDNCEFLYEYICLAKGSITNTTSDYHRDRIGARF